MLRTTTRYTDKSVDHIFKMFETFSIPSPRALTCVFPAFPLYFFKTSPLLEYKLHASSNFCLLCSLMQPSTQIALKY